MAIIPEQAGESRGFRLGERARAGVELAARIQRRADATEIRVPVAVEVDAVAAFASEPCAQTVQERIVRASFPSVLLPQSIGGPSVHVT